MRRAGRRAGPRTKAQGTFDPFLLLCAAHGLGVPDTEVVFAPPRKYRADYCFRVAKVIVEKNGGIWTKGGHSSGRGLLRDYAKYNLAQLQGWKVLVYTPAQLENGAAIADLKQVLGEDVHVPA